MSCLWVQCVRRCRPPAGHACARPSPPRPPAGGAGSTLSVVRAALLRCNGEPRCPTRSPATGRRPDSLRRQTGASKQPGDHGVRVPHLAHPELVTAPRESRYQSNEFEEAVCLARVSTEVLQTRDRMVQLGHDPALPAAQLVAKDANVWDVAACDRPLADHTARCALSIGDRRHLDYEASLAQVDLERSVVEVERVPPLDAGLDGLEEKPAQPDERPGSAERPPVQVDAGVERLRRSWLTDRGCSLCRRRCRPRRRVEAGRDRCRNCGGRLSRADRYARSGRRSG